jgi:hypothetical protein
VCVCVCVCVRYVYIHAHARTHTHHYYIYTRRRLLIHSVRLRVIYVLPVKFKTETRESIFTRPSVWDRTSERYREDSANRTVYQPMPLNGDDARAFVVPRRSQAKKLDGRIIIIIIIITYTAAIDVVPKAHTT